MRARSTRPDPSGAQFRASGRASAAECIGMLGPGVRVIGLTMGQFSLLDLVRAVLDQVGPSAVTISTWTTGIRDAENAKWLVETGQIRRFRLLTDRSFATRQPEYCAAVRRLFGDDCIACTNIHAKFALIAGAALKVAIRSSMNLNRNPRFEQFDLDCDDTIHDWLAGVSEEIAEAMPPGPVVECSTVDDVFYGLLGGRERDGRKEKEAPATPTVSRAQSARVRALLGLD